MPLTRSPAIAGILPKRGAQARAGTSGSPFRLSVKARIAVAGLIAYVGLGLAHSSPPDVILAAQLAHKRVVGAPRAAPAPLAPISIARTPVVTTSKTGADQAGYVHYFIITGPDGEPESQVGIELPGDQIAWSFPRLGVVVSPFVASGVMMAHGTPYDVQHLYGLRPFSDDPSMRALQQELSARVALWVQHETPYCDEERPPSQVCVSCLGFVLRVLYPASSAAFAALPALPPDFKSARKNVYTTEDLLLYLAGVQVDAPREARNKRIEMLAVPEAMREQLLRISSETDSAPAVASAGVNAPKRAAAKSRPAARSIVDLPKRVLTRRRS